MMLLRSLHRKLDILAYSFFFIPYSEPVLTFSLPCLRDKQKLYSLPQLPQLLFSVCSVYSVVVSVLLGI